MKKKLTKSTERLDDLFSTEINIETVDSVIGSGYEEEVAKLAIIDKVAYRAARKNMQKHSAIILKLDGVFSGFFTFQINHDAKEFCLLQSAMYEDKKNKAIYSKMIDAIIAKNTYGYNMFMTVSAKHDLERPDVFNARGFNAYLVKSDFHYMVHGDIKNARLKLLAHIGMTNIWNSVKGDWLKIKREWNEKIEKSGEASGVINPKFATREGCWQGSSGFSNVVTGKSLNGNASVLDPAACEIIARMFMPKDGGTIYNPFGGGVQFGYVAGGCGYKYIASEIRKNQCDANNAICQQFDSVKWVHSDSSKYKPSEPVDMVFSCPPYYKVERYIDYDGKPPEGELNDMETYEQFRDTLFSGYKLAIEAMKDDSFFVVMTGDSRGPSGGYFGCEAEHELFFKQQGLLIYNRIVYLESEFTRRAQAKITLHHRKFPKAEQKILVFYKGDPSHIRSKFTDIGRL